MKNVWVSRSIVFMAVVTLIVFSSISNSDASEDRTGWPSSVSFLTKGAGGSSYAIGAGLSKMITKYLKLPATVEPAAGSQAEIEVLKAGKGEFAFCANMEGYLAIHSKGYWKKRGGADVRQVTSGTPLRWGVIVRKDSKIYSPKDLAGKRVFAYLSGSSVMKRFAELLWQAYGIEGKVKEQPYTLVSECKDAIKEKRISAFIYPAIPRMPILVELATTIGIRFLPISGKEADFMVQEPSFGKRKIAAKSFPGQDKEVPALAFYQDVFCRTNLPDSFVYAVTKMMYDHFDEWLAVHRIVKFYDLKSYFDNPVIPFHAGSVRYYREKGVWGPDQDKIQKKHLQSIGKAK